MLCAYWEIWYVIYYDDILIYKHKLDEYSIKIARAIILNITYLKNQDGEREKPNEMFFRC